MLIIMFFLYKFYKLKNRNNIAKLFSINMINYSINMIIYYLL